MIVNKTICKSLILQLIYGGLGEKQLSEVRYTGVNT